jgi:hypothetical protein
MSALSNSPYSPDLHGFVEETVKIACPTVTAVNVPRSGRLRRRPVPQVRDFW